MQLTTRIERYGPGEEVPNPRPGDFILVRSPGWLGRIVTWAQRSGLRDPDRRRFAHWSHAALVVSTGGHIVDVGPRGVRLGHLRCYRGVDYHYVRLAGSLAERLLAVRYARGCVGERYARLAPLAVGMLLDGPRSASRPGRHSCASVVAGALAQAGAAFDRDPARMTPADLARHFDVTP